MLFRIYKPKQRSKFSSLSYALEELKLIRSWKDLMALSQKTASYLPRLTGLYKGNNPVPPSVQIEPTNHCNAHCLSCPTRDSLRPRGFMDYGLFKNIVDEAGKLGIKRIRLYLHGEPMLHPRIIDMISYIKSKDIAVSLTTNGIRLDKETARAILSSGVNIADIFTVSILGYSKEVHERIMRGVDHESVLNNISFFLEERERRGSNGPIIETIFYAMPDNSFEEKEYLEHWQGRVDHARLGGWISESFADYHQKRKTVAPRHHTCTNLWERLTVYWNGDVSLCDQDVDGRWILGSLAKQTITEIWKCDQLQSVRRIHKQKRFQDFPFCYYCDM